MGNYGGNVFAVKDDAKQKPIRPSNWLWQAIVLSLCCMPVFGVIAMIFAVQVNSKYDLGDYEGAVRAANLARMFVIVGLALGIIYVFFIIFSTLMGGLIEVIEALVRNEEGIYDY